MRETVLTYPLLAGIGITAGEAMREQQGEFSKESWLWKTHGEGIRDALKIQPGREIRLIHRYHQTGQTEIIDQFKEYPGSFDLSFKYSVAHMYSIPNPPFIQELLPNLPPGKRTWLTVRNDCIYSPRWGDPAYARAYIGNIPRTGQSRWLLHGTRRLYLGPRVPLHRARQSAPIGAFKAVVFLHALGAASATIQSSPTRCFKRC